MQVPSASWSTEHALAHKTRDPLASVWLSLPTDLLEGLWASPLGTATRTLVSELTSDSQLTQQQIEFRNRLTAQLGSGLQQPLAPQLLIASFLYSPVGKLKIANPEQHLPAWLATGYRDLYEPRTEAASSPQPTGQQPPSPDPLPALDFPLELAELVKDRVHLNRMLGLSNLYYIDPDDDEIREELLSLRRAFAHSVLRAPEAQLQQLWATDLGDRYWSLVRSGIQKVNLDPVDQQIKDAAIRMLSPQHGGGFNKPGAINSFIVSMMYFEPGTMNVPDPDKKIPVWLRQQFDQIFVHAIADNS